MAQYRDSYNSPTSRPLYRGVQVISYLFGILEVLLAFRFVLKLAGANPGAAFTQFIYSITYPFAAPFLAVFRITVTEGRVFEWTTLLAMIVYWIIEIAIVRLLVMSRTVSTAHAAERLEEEDTDSDVEF